ncbi:MAG: hypothetical protein LBM60_05215 [Clostridium sp.]|jgi:hypothetical protein|nr:hypothetical protein [Clostridium sp.]
MSDWDFIWEEHLLPTEPKAEATATYLLEENGFFVEQEKEPDPLKHIILVDYENVHTSGLKGIIQATSRDEIVIFYSDSHEKSIAFIRELCRDIQFAKIAKGGQNALDFQLSSYLGYRIHKAACKEELSGTEFMIISKDTGFDSVVKFWMSSPIIKQMGAQTAVVRAGSIEKAFAASQTAPFLRGLSEAEQQKINEIMEKEASLSNFHMELCKEYGSERGRAFYYHSKGQFKKLHHV